MNKIVFVLHRRSDLSRDAALEEWTAPEHTAFVAAIPGLACDVQNKVVAAAGQAICDGIGELWFHNADAVQAALTSPELAAASSDATRFLDMEKTGLVVVTEHSVIGDPTMFS